MRLTRRLVLSLSVGLACGFGLSALGQSVPGPGGRATGGKGKSTHPVTPVQSGKPGTPSTGAVPARGAGSGGFRTHGRVPLSPGVVVVLLYSPYVGAPVEVPSNPQPTNPSFPSCQSVQDCGEGQLGHGALCDRGSFGLGLGDTGVCREACRDDDDCAGGQTCEGQLDPDDFSWNGCVAAVP